MLNTSNLYPFIHQCYMLENWTGYKKEYLTIYIHICMYICIYTSITAHIWYPLLFVESWILLSKDPIFVSLDSIILDRWLFLSIT